MEQIEATERRLRNLYLSPEANKPRARLEIAHIFQRTNFGFGKQNYNQPVSLSQKQYPKYGDVTAKFDIAREKTKMRQTNYKFGELNGGFDSVYVKQFEPKQNDDRTIITKQDKNRLEASHWDHSRSWSQNFRTEQLNKFKGERNDKAFTSNKIFGYQNTLNQIGTHYKLGTNPTNFESTSMSKFRDNSSDRQPLYGTRRVKDYQEKSHFALGNEGYPKMTSTWTHFSKRHTNN